MVNKCFLLVSTIPEGLAVDFTFDGSAEGPVNVGEYVVTATINDANYIGSSYDTLVIEPALALIILDEESLTQVYDGESKVSVGINYSRRT